MFNGCNCSLPMDCCEPYTIILPEDVRSVTMAALQRLLEDGSCQVRGETGRRDILQLQSLLQCNAGIGRTGRSSTQRRIKERWIVRRREDEPVSRNELEVEPMILPVTNVDCDSGGRSYQCDQCMKICSSMKSLGDHKGRVHSELKLCHQCPKKFTREDNLRRHVKEVHQTISSKFVCNVCG